MDSTSSSAVALDMPSDASGKAAKKDRSLLALAMRVVIYSAVCWGVLFFNSQLAKIHQARAMMDNEFFLEGQLRLVVDKVVQTCGLGDNACAQVEASTLVEQVLPAKEGFSANHRNEIAQAVMKIYPTVRAPGKSTDAIFLRPKSSHEI